MECKRVQTTADSNVVIEELQYAIDGIVYQIYDHLVYPNCNDGGLRRSYRLHTSGIDRMSYKENCAVYFYKTSAVVYDIVASVGVNFRRAHMAQGNDAWQMLVAETVRAVANVVYATSNCPLATSLDLLDCKERNIASAALIDTLQEMLAVGSNTRIGIDIHCADGLTVAVRDNVDSLGPLTVVYSIQVKAYKK